MIETDVVDAVDTPGLAVIASRAHLDSLKVTDLEKTDRLNLSKGRDAVALYHLDGSDKFIQMDDQWYRFIPDRNNGKTGLIFKEGSRNNNNGNRISNVDGIWYLDRGAELRGGQGGTAAKISLSHSESVICKPCTDVVSHGQAGAVVLGDSSDAG
jgi:hypothetical protein